MPQLILSYFSEPFSYPFTFKYFSEFIKIKDNYLYNHSIMNKVRKFNIDIILLTNLQLIFKYCQLFQWCSLYQFFSWFRIQSKIMICIWLWFSLACNLLIESFLILALSFLTMMFWRVLANLGTSDVSLWFDSGYTFLAETLHN